MAIETTAKLGGLSRKVDKDGHEFCEFKLRVYQVDLWYELVGMLDSAVTVTIANAQGKLPLSPTGEGPCCEGCGQRIRGIPQKVKGREVCGEYPACVGEG